VLFSDVRFQEPNQRYSAIGLRDGDFKIYALQDSTSGNVVYVGQTHTTLDHRFKTHLSNPTCALAAIINVIYAKQGKLVMNLLKTCRSQSETNLAEKQYIDAFWQLGCPLANDDYVERNALGSVYNLSVLEMLDEDAKTNGSCSAKVVVQKQHLYLEITLSTSIQSDKLAEMCGGIEALFAFRRDYPLRFPTQRRTRFDQDTRRYYSLYHWKRHCYIDPSLLSGDLTLSKLPDWISSLESKRIRKLIHMPDDDIRRFVRGSIGTKRTKA